MDSARRPEPGRPPATEHDVPGTQPGQTPSPDEFVIPDFAGRYQFLAAPQRPDEIGRIGPYRVLAELGSGGMGVVFRVEDPQLKRHVALKVLHPRFGSDRVARARFVREARAQAAIEHDRVVPIYQVGEAGGVLYIKMPMLRGETLGSALKRSGRLPVLEVMRIGQEVAEGLAAAHEVGLIHRDVKPENIWLAGSRRRVKLLDFGLVRAAEGAANPDEPLTAKGSVLGTPYYMAPEQAHGRRVDPRTDLFSLGVVLYQAATGRLPFSGSSPPAVMLALVNDEPTPPIEVAPDLPREFSDLILRLLAKNPADRPQSAAALADELHQLVLERARSLVTIPVDPIPDPAADPSTEFDFVVSNDVVRPSGRHRPPPRSPDRAWLAWAAVIVVAAATAGLLVGVLLS